MNLKETDEELELMIDSEVENFRQELDRIFQHTVYLSNVVNSHMETNAVKYSEVKVPVVMLENSDETKEVNDHFRMSSPQPLKHKLVQ